LIERKNVAPVLIFFQSNEELYDITIFVRSSAKILMAKNLLHSFDIAEADACMIEAFLFFLEALLYKPNVMRVTLTN
jgi:hypothetical protein